MWVFQYSKNHFTEALLLRKIEFSYIKLLAAGLQTVSL